MAPAVGLYRDENLSHKIAEQLQLRGIDAVSVRDLDALGDTDLLRATSVGRVLVTADNDFLYLANVTDEHSGIIFDGQEDHSLGDWVKNLELICLIYSPQGDYSGIETE